MRHTVITILFIILLKSGFSQNITTKKIVQFSGIVLSSDSLEALPYAVIYDKNIGKGTYSNYSGFFSFAASEGDSIYFSYVGFRKKLVVIPSNLPDDKYNMIQLLSADTVNLPVTIIRPYPKPAEFKQAFLNLKIPDDDMDRAIKNLTRMSREDLVLSVPIDGREAASSNIRNYSSTFYYRGQAPPQAILNPLAWVDFFNAWKRGDFKKKQYY